MIRAVIVDDERPALELLQRMLLSQGGIEVVGVFTNSRQAIEQIGHLRPDVVFLDIEMPGANGLEATDQVLAADGNIDVVFVTAFDQYAVEAFELNALDYLLKPISAERLQKTVSRIITRRGAGTDKRGLERLGRILWLGTLEVTDQDSEPVVINWRTAKTRELFAYFLHHRSGSVAKDRLIEALWPGLERERATRMLHTTIYYLRKILQQHGHGEVLQYANNQYVFRLEKVYFDAEEFQKLACSCQESREAGAAMQSLTKAVELYRGDYMEEDGFEWAAGECQRLQQLYLGALRQLAKYSVEFEDYHTAELFLEKWLAKEPLDEEAHCLMMEVYARQRKHQLLVRQYETYRNILLEELGAEPGKPVKMLFYKLLNESLE